MNHKPGSAVPQSGIYWCTVCKLPASFQAGEQFPSCTNLCGRGNWEFVRAEEPSDNSGPVRI